MTSHLLLALALASGASAPDSIVRVRATGTAEAVLARVGPVLTQRNLRLFGTVDHAANAEAAGLTLGAATVFTFGNPAVGTRVMQCDPASALDLPLRLLVWEDADGGVWVGYHDPAALASRYRLADCAQVLGAMSRAMAAVAGEVAGRPPQ